MAPDPTPRGFPWYAALPATLPAPSERWATPEFEAELREWVSGALGRVDDLELVHLRPWSTLWKVRRGEEVFWAKQNCSHQSFEARLLALLGDIAPALVVPVVAVEPDRGLHLVRDHGAVLSESLGAGGEPDDVGTWCRVAAQGMHLQRLLVDRIDEVVAVVLTVMPAWEAPAYVEARAASLAALPEDDPRRLLPDGAASVVALGPAVREWAEQLAAVDLPDTLVHNDLHAGNVFATPSGLRFFDFGDAVVAHPLTALSVPVNIVRHRLGAAPDDPRVRRVADAALEVWSDAVPAPDLRRALPAALRLGRLGRVESWLRVTASMTRPELAEYGDGAAYWLTALREEPALT